MGRGTRFCRQHDAPLGGRRRDDAVRQPRRPRARRRPVARRCASSVNQRRKRVRLLRGYPHPRHLAAANKGSTRQLSNGNLLVGWGAVADDHRVHAPRPVVFDAHFARADDGTYRAIRARWDGRPATAPRAAPDGTTVWASWNGATEVARWRVLGGDSASALKPLTTARKRGFETAIELDAGAAFRRRGGARRRRQGAQYVASRDRALGCRACGSSGRSRCGRGRAASTSSPTSSCPACPSCATSRVGLAHLFIRHTSASLTLNENASPDVRDDFEAWFNEAVPEDAPLLDPHDRGPGRHARAHQGLAARPGAHDPGPRRAGSRSAPGRACTCASTAITAARARSS